MIYRIRRWSAALLLGMLLSLLSILQCFAAGSVSQVNLHIGQTPDAVYFTYSAPDAAQGTFSVTGPKVTADYDANPVWSDSAGKYLYSAKVDGLAPDTNYTYNIAGSYSGTFKTPANSGAFTFAFLTDTQIGFAADAKATGAMFSLLNSRDDLAFAYIAGDMTDSSRNERQWEMLFENGGVNAGAGQTFFGSHLIAAAQGNHDTSSFSGHITAPCANSGVGPVVYAFDYSNVKFVVLNMNNPGTWAAQANFLRQQAADAKNNGKWLVAGIISARKFWSPLFAELGVDLVLQGHDHVYARGFVTSTGSNANLTAENNTYHVVSGVPLYITGGHSGAVKWYAARNYQISAGDPLTPNYSFLDVNSAASAQNPWGTDTSKTHEQSYILINVNGNTMNISTYMFRYDGISDKMTTPPYLYDSLTISR